MVNWNGRIVQVSWLIIAVSAGFKAIMGSPMPPALPRWDEDYDYPDYGDQSCVVESGETYGAWKQVPSDEACQTCTCEPGPLGGLVVCDSSACGPSSDDELDQDQNCTMENGQVYPAGASLPSNNPCQSCSCVSGPVGALVVCVTSNPNCTSESTKDYSQQSCTVRGGQVFQAGALVPSSDSCQSCRCEAAPLGALVVCMSQDCGFPRCVDATTLPDTCCPVCPNGPSCYFGDAILRPADGERRMATLTDVCGIWCRCHTNGDLTCATHCTTS